MVDTPNTDKQVGLDTVRGKDTSRYKAQQNPSFNGEKMEEKTLNNQQKSKQNPLNNLQQEENPSNDLLQQNPLNNHQQTNHNPSNNSVQQEENPSNYLQQTKQNPTCDSLKQQQNPSNNSLQQHNPSNNSLHEEENPSNTNGTAGEIGLLINPPNSDVTSQSYGAPLGWCPSQNGDNRRRPLCTWSWARTPTMGRALVPGNGWSLGWSWSPTQRRVNWGPYQQGRWSWGKGRLSLPYRAAYAGSPLNYTYHPPRTPCINPRHPFWREHLGTGVKSQKEPNKRDGKNGKDLDSDKEHNTDSLTPSESTTKLSYPTTPINPDLSVNSNAKENSNANTDKNLVLGDKIQRNSKVEEENKETQKFMRLDSEDDEDERDNDEKMTNLPSIHNKDDEIEMSDGKEGKMGERSERGEMINSPLNYSEKGDDLMETTDEEEGDMSQRSEGSDKEKSSPPAQNISLEREELNLSSHWQQGNDDEEEMSVEEEEMSEEEHEKISRHKTTITSYKSVKEIIITKKRRYSNNDDSDGSEYSAVNRKKRCTEISQAIETEDNKREGSMLDRVLPQDNDDNNDDSDYEEDDDEYNNSHENYTKVNDSILDRILKDDNKISDVDENGTKRQCIQIPASTKSEEHYNKDEHSTLDTVLLQDDRLVDDDDEISDVDEGSTCIRKPPTESDKLSDSEEVYNKKDDPILDIALQQDERLEDDDDEVSVLDEESPCIYKSPTESDKLSDSEEVFNKEDDSILDRVLQQDDSLDDDDISVLDEESTCIHKPPTESDKMRDSEEVYNKEDDSILDRVLRQDERLVGDDDDDDISDVDEVSTCIHKPSTESDKLSDSEEVYSKEDDLILDRGFPQDDTLVDDEISDVNEESLCVRKPSTEPNKSKDSEEVYNKEDDPILDRVLPQDGTLDDNEISVLDEENTCVRKPATESDEISDRETLQTLSLSEHFPNDDLLPKDEGIETGSEFSLLGRQEIQMQTGEEVRDYKELNPLPKGNSDKEVESQEDIRDIDSKISEDGEKESLCKPLESHTNIYHDDLLHKKNTSSENLKKSGVEIENMVISEGISHEEADKEEEMVRSSDFSRVGDKKKRRCIRKPVKRLRKTAMDDKRRKKDGQKAVKKTPKLPPSLKDHGKKNEEPPEEEEEEVAMDDKKRKKDGQKAVKKTQKLPSSLKDHGKKNEEPPEEVEEEEVLDNAEAEAMLSKEAILAYVKNFAIRNHPSSHQHRTRMETRAMTQQLARRIPNHEFEYIAAKRAEVFKAAEDGIVERVRELVQDTGVAIRHSGHGGTLLHAAARHGQLDVILALLPLISPNTVDHLGRTPAHLAALAGHTQVLRLLLADQDFDLTICDNSGRTYKHLLSRSLAEAVVQGQRGRALELLRLGADPDTPDPDSVDSNANDNISDEGNSNTTDPSKIDSNTSDGNVSVGKQGTTPRQMAEVLQQDALVDLFQKVKPKDKEITDSDGSSEGTSLQSLAGERTQTKVDGPPVPMDQDAVPSGPDVYPMTSEHKGYMCILSYGDFKDRPDLHLGGYRYGAQNMAGVFSNIGYKGQAHFDLTAEQTKKEIITVRSLEELNGVSCAVIYISSHGTSSGDFLASDRKLVSNEWVYSAFQDSYCPQLKGKPKVFIFDLCYGHCNGEGNNSSREEAQGLRWRVTEPLRDTAVLYSSCGGITWYTFNEGGSMFTSTLCNTLTHHATHKELYDIYRHLVTQCTSADPTAAPHLLNIAFTKKFYFNPNFATV